ncbi:ubiquitin-conjugating enzyme E2Q-like protein 1 isoform X2 [Cimex lectularius]|uniref:E2 ubiquitin-conjugating enzyme n=1 Tax=Cimex lectularius TaxID=79782 RepID=A0A8I6RNG1_CIMLE|nr:ubiquitin-conjugating enzyme E2Q-like protein 1 isoform X2 [Cimex lectularius]
MTSRAKEKVVSAFNRIFRGAERLEKEPGAGGVQGGSPGRRLIRHAGYHVTPAEDGKPGTSRPSSQGFFKKKPSNKGAPAIDPSCQKSVRTRRLMKELQDIERSQQKDSPIFTVELINDNLYDWHVRLYGIDEESELAADMREFGIKCISLQLTFPENFPFVPPFMRVVTPRIEKGFVMEGGAICMELLTPRGWASAYTVEAIVMQFAASIVKGQGRISKKTKSSSKDFNRHSAEESFRSLVKTHDKYGWVTPPLADG